MVIFEKVSRRRSYRSYIPIECREEYLFRAVGFGHGMICISKQNPSCTSWLHNGTA